MDDENDNSPVISILFRDYNDTIQLSSAAASVFGHVVAVVTATDPDAGDNGRLVFSAAGGDDDYRLFDVDEKTGEVKVHRALPDVGLEAPVTYHVKVWFLVADCRTMSLL